MTSAFVRGRALLLILACAACGASPGAHTASIDAALRAPDTASVDASVGADLGADVSATVSPCPGGAGCACTADEECDDGNPCTYGGACVDAACTAGILDPCDDGDACSDDNCAPATGCVHTLGNGPCQDGDECTIGDACKNDVCIPGKAKTCDDGNECTDDSCKTSVGCTYTHNTAQCHDGNVCLDPSFCADGDCVQGKWKPCDDGNACTYETCEPVGGCVSLPVPLPAPCTGSAVEKWGRCAQAFPAAGTWLQARKACQGWGGELASVRNSEENAWLRDVADAGCGKDAAAWIGASDAVQEGAWRWSDGTHVHFGAWAENEPNNSGGNEDFAELLPGGTWNDADGSAAPCRICARMMATGCDDPLGCDVGATCAGGACQKPDKPRDCNDDDACTLDACAPGAGCSHTALAVGAACGQGGACGAAGCIMPKSDAIPSSCLAVQKATPGAISGVYWIDADGAGSAAPFQAWCDLGGDGGGWTLALKLDGADPKADYDAPLWTDSVAINPGSAALDAATAKLPSFWTLPLQQLRVGLRAVDKDGKVGPLRWLVLDVAAPSLRDAFAGGKPLPTKAGVFAWETLLANASLQIHCHAEGLNIQSTGSAGVRVGILGNNEDDCGSVDSWLGVGGRANICGVQGKPTSGNVACWYPDYGDRATISWAYLMVR